MSVPISGSFTVCQGELSSEATRNLIRRQLTTCTRTRYPKKLFGLDLSGLNAPEVTVWTVWAGEQIALTGALRDLAGKTGEVKRDAHAPAIFTTRSRLGAARGRYRYRTCAA